MKNNSIYVINTNKQLQKGDYINAAKELKNSDYYNQTGRRAKAVSFYLHEEQISALTLLSSILGKSQSQIIRDHIYELAREYLVDTPGLFLDSEHEAGDYEFAEPDDTVKIAELDLTLDAILNPRHNDD